MWLGWCRVLTGSLRTELNMSMSSDNLQEPPVFPVMSNEHIHMTYRDSATLPLKINAILTYTIGIFQEPLSVCLSVRLSVCLSVCLSYCRSILQCQKESCKQHHHRPNNSPFNMFTMVSFYFYSPYSQITNCLIGLNRVQHPLFLTLNKRKTTPKKTINREKFFENSEETTCEGSFSEDSRCCLSLNILKK